MSIYCSRLHVGDYWRHDDQPAGRVGIYGGSHLYEPLTTRANISTAHTPTWCVPGHEDSDDGDERPFGEWLRLSITSDAADVTVLIDEATAAALRDDLAAWIAAEKAVPK